MANIYIYIYIYIYVCMYVRKKIDNLSKVMNLLSRKINAITLWH